MAAGRQRGGLRGTQFTALSHHLHTRRQGHAEAKRILKAEITRRHRTYKDVVEKLATVGISETEANLRNKISRGGFSAGFFISCLVAIGAHTVWLYEVE